MKLTHLSSASIAFASSMLATGIVVSYPEVIPGPGLPGLADIGVTSAQLYVMELPSTSAKILARFQPYCGPAEQAYANVKNIVACYHYLNKLGHTQCTVSAGWSEFCFSGNGKITGFAYGEASQSSYCSDVAHAVLYTIDHCTRPDQSVAGLQAANGNGNLIVSSVNRKWDGHRP
ncbi:hypothetical protein HIM_08883 [Hirsutella minnesotensis 3608]|uniref:Ecp2 effector protein domain-containing protein n=1 Tax=Hirsutella minnesotensis 3608 TaxID=1043627 RepID=A0A0F7ZGZ3_9HYPO|nr:hypothetical protein HIM_08883 [Hirsutella minnesotensis 3608]